MSIQNHKFVVIDEIYDMLESVKSGVEPGTVSQSVVSGIQNVPVNIKQKSITGSSQTAYTTLPLSPIQKNCCNIDKTYINCNFDVNCKITINGIANYIYPMYIGFRDTASLFRQFDLLIENSTIYSTIYQRQESVLNYNALPETEIRGNNQYASIDKLINNIDCPMVRYELQNGVNEVELHFNITVDLNRLNTLISNLHFTTPHMGNLKIKLYFDDFANSLFFCPDYKIAQDPIITDTPTATTLNGLRDKTKNNEYWCFYPFKKYANNTAIANIKLYGYNILSGADATNKFDKGSILIAQATNFTITDPTGKDFLTFANGGNIEIVQCNFDISTEEYNAFGAYLAKTGSLILPTQVWSTNVFNNSTIKAGSGWNQTMIGSIGAYNINNVQIYFPSSQQSTCLQKEFLNDFQLLLDGKPINPIRYEYINNKCVTDCCQSIFDTDTEEINKDYINSLTFLNGNMSRNYINTDVHTLYEYGINKLNLRNPNTFTLSFCTNLPNAFHSGACTLEMSNRQAVLRFESTRNANMNGYIADTYPLIENSKINDTECMFSCFCDCLLVLNYDTNRNCCFDGNISWASPF